MVLGKDWWLEIRNADNRIIRTCYFSSESEAVKAKKVLAEYFPQSEGYRLDLEHGVRL
ncbi:hypothetical protein [Streptococcus hyointestinalis]|nr:hypothetical protein [Streptococcus hyointestinalis]